MDKMKIGETIYDAVGMVVLIVLAACGEELFGTPQERTLIITVLWQLLMLRSAANRERHGKRTEDAGEGPQPGSRAPSAPVDLNDECL